MKKPKVLYHGSDKRISLLAPRVPVTDVKISARDAVYATDEKEYAMGVALANSKHTNSFGKFEDGVHKALFNVGRPRMKYIYVHYLSPRNFVHNRKDEWISYKPVKPYKIEKVKVADLGWLWRKASDEEFHEFMKEREKRLKKELGKNWKKKMS
jgi:hypothetical protein